MDDQRMAAIAQKLVGGSARKRKAPNKPAQVDNRVLCFTGYIRNGGAARLNQPNWLTRPNPAYGTAHRLSLSPSSPFCRADRSAHVRGQHISAGIPVHSGMSRLAGSFCGPRRRTPREPERAKLCQRVFIRPPHLPARMRCEVT